jgi:hypothetical protein
LPFAEIAGTHYYYCLQSPKEFPDVGVVHGNSENIKFAFWGIRAKKPEDGQ